MATANTTLVTHVWSLSTALNQELMATHPSPRWVQGKVRVSKHPSSTDRCQERDGSPSTPHSTSELGKCYTLFLLQVSHSRKQGNLLFSLYNFSTLHSNKLSVINMIYSIPEILFG